MIPRHPSDAGTCPHCGCDYDVPEMRTCDDDLADMEYRCPNCQYVFSVGPKSSRPLTDEEARTIEKTLEEFNEEDDS